MNKPADPNTEGMDFATVMASTVHDMKNTMAMMLQTYETWLERLPPELTEAPERGIIQYESMRLHGMLVQLLGLYKMETNRLPVNPIWNWRPVSLLSNWRSVCRPRLRKRATCPVRRKKPSLYMV